MRRAAGLSVGVAIAAAVIVACGGHSPAGPTQGNGGGGTTGGGNGGGTPNTPPVITSIVVADSHAEVGIPTTVTATVTDAETPVENLKFAWDAPNGRFSGTGPVVTWTPGADAVTPGDFTLNLTVTEQNAGGATINTVTGSVPVHVNNSPKELADLSLKFLGDFADSNVSPDTCVSQFAGTTCKSGKDDEFSNISDNRHDFTILSSTLRATGVDWSAPQTKATVHTFCAFESRILHTPATCSPADCPIGYIQRVEGDCYTTDVYESGRWWLCTSHFTASSSSNTPTAFIRSFFGIRRPEFP